MSRIAVLALLIAASLLTGMPCAQVQAQVITQEEAARLTAARDTVAKIEREKGAQAENFNGLLELRDQVDQVRENLRDVVTALQERLTEAQAQLTALGAPPAQGTPVDPAAQAERVAKQALVNDIDGHFRRARSLQVQTDQLWDSMNDLRRSLFNRRILLHQDSVLSPGFWHRVATESIPDFLWRAHFKLIDIDRSIDRKQGWSAIYGLGALAAAATFSLIWLRRRMAIKWRSAVRGSDVQLQKSDIVGHAAIVLVMRLLPFAVMALVIWLGVTRFDLVTDEVKTFLLGVAGASIVYGIGNGAIRAIFAPDLAACRIIRADDHNARRIVRVFDSLLAIYLVGLIILGIVQTLTAHLSLTIAVTGLLASIVVITGMTLLFHDAASEEMHPTRGLVDAPLRLLRPMFWITAAVIIGALLLGYIALAGFLVGRALATVTILSVAVLIYVAADTLFLEAIAPDKPANRRIASMTGINPAAVDLGGTIIAGVLRTLTVVLTILVLLSPWGIEFGNLNPLEDVFFGVRFGDLRGWLGVAGIMLLLFIVGMVATRLFVTWLDQQLLPRTGLNTGVRHSISTISGYIGLLVATAIALSQAGVQLQNIALVASALSVGIGFGLQQVVSNFVAGLIVLAERPIRVGDVIVVRGEEGKVKKISVRATELQLGENSTVIVPNSDIVSSIVKNRSFVDPTHRATIRLGLASDTDLDLAFDILRKAANSHPNVIKEPAPSVYITQVNQPRIEVDLHVLCDRIGAIDAVRSDLFYEALAKFRQNGINLA